MIRKWIVFAMSAALLVSLGAGLRRSVAQDEKESELEKIMEKVNKQSANIKKGTRNVSYFRKGQKDVEKSAKELVKLGKKAKPIKDALKKAKDESDPQKKWNELIDALISNSEKLEKVVAKSDATYAEAKKAAGAVNKSCVDCHTVFRVDEDSSF